MKYDLKYLKKRSTPQGDCLLWKQQTTSVRGPSVNVRLANGTRAVMRVSRFAWFVYKGELPGRLDVLTSCENPRCVAEAHLYTRQRSKGYSEQKSAGSVALVPATATTAFSEEAVKLVTSSVTEEGTRNVYAQAVRAFFVWTSRHDVTKLSIDSVLQYRDAMRKEGLSASTTNIRLIVLRTLAVQLRLRGALSAEDEFAIRQVKLLKISKPNKGTWLTKEQMQKMIDTTPRRRDKALLAVFCFTGLRCSEVAGLTWEQYQRVDNRMAFVNVRAKGNKYITVGVPNAAVIYIDLLKTDAHIFSVSSARLFPMSTGRISDLIQQTAEHALGIPSVKPHDLRRSYARACYDAGADILAISQSLGHADTKTTLKYIGAGRKLDKVPGDLL